MTKKRIIVLLVVVVGIAATIYAVSLATKNFAVLALSPLVLGFLACPLMCGVMGGGMWLMGRLSRNKQKQSLQKNVDGCCQHDEDHNHDNIHEDYYQNRRTRNNADDSIKRLDNIDPRSNINISPDLNTPNATTKNKFNDLS
jgi:hypothetical protein